jgi:hypothetical protein
VVPALQASNEAAWPPPPAAFLEADYEGVYVGSLQSYYSGVLVHARISLNTTDNSVHFALLELGYAWRLKPVPPKNSYSNRGDVEFVIDDPSEDYPICVSREFEAYAGSYVVLSTSANGTRTVTVPASYGLVFTKMT